MTAILFKFCLNVYTYKRSHVNSQQRDDVMCNDSLHRLRNHQPKKFIRHISPLDKVNANVVTRTVHNSIATTFSVYRA